MIRSILVLLLSAASLAMAAGGGDKHHEMELSIVRSDGNGTFHFDSEDAGFRLLDIQVGENRSYVDGEGRNVLITRRDTGFDVNIDGESFEIPAPGNLHLDSHISPDFGDLDIEIDHDVIRHEIAAAFPGTLVRTGQPLDAETRQAIEGLLRGAGEDGAIHFVDAETHAGPVVREVRVIRRKDR